jgi:hypothetical protein
MASNPQEESNRLSVLEARLQNCDKLILASTCLSVRPSVLPHGITEPPVDGFS